MSKPKIIAVVGPTASGKSALGAYLAKKLGGEVVSADSRQVYKGMHIISRAEKGHMVGIADPAKQFSAGEYVKHAQKICAHILENKRTPIVLGGTGFYADALLGRMPLPQVEPDKKLRTKLNKRSAKQLMAQLKTLDPTVAVRVDPANLVRLVRAIEIAKAGPLPPGDTASPYRVLWLGLRQSKNLNAGVEARLRAGMVAEAKRLRGALPRRRYKELGFEFDLLSDYLDKKISRQELVEKIANGERKYAKRQNRWFKRNPDIHWVKSRAEALRLSKKFLR